MKTWLPALSIVALSTSLAFGEAATPPASTSKRDWEKRFKKLDTNSDGKLTLEEFLAGSMGQKTPKKAKVFFAEIDKSNKGYITLEQWMTAHSNEPAPEPTPTTPPTKPTPAEPASTQASGHGNLFVNASLEQGLKGWEFEEGGLGPRSIVSLDETVKYQGKPSLRIQSAAKGSSGNAYQTLKLKPNTDYLLTAYVRTKDVKTVQPPLVPVGAAVGFFGGEHSEPLVGTNTEWKKVTYKFNTQSGTENEVSLFLGIYPAPVTGTAWFAGMTLEEVGPPKK